MKKDYSYFSLCILLIIIIPSCLLSQALTFDGSNDYVSISNNIVDQTFKDRTVFSVSAWVYGAGDATKSVLCKGNTDNSGGNSKSVQIFNDGSRLSIILYSSNGSFIRIKAKESYLSANAWNLITFTYDGGLNPNSLSIYKNGVLNEDLYESHEHNTFTGMDSNTDPLYIGARVQENGTPHLVWNGKIDEVAVWSDDLSAAEIVTLYNSGAGLNPTSNSGNYASSSDLEGYWPVNKNSGSTVFDGSTNNNSGADYGDPVGAGVYLYQLQAKDFVKTRKMVLLK